MYNMLCVTNICHYYLSRLSSNLYKAFQSTLQFQTKVIINLNPNLTAVFETGLNRSYFTSVLFFVGLIFPYFL